MFRISQNWKWQMSDCQTTIKSDYPVPVVINVGAVDECINGTGIDKERSAMVHWDTGHDPARLYPVYQQFRHTSRTTMLLRSFWVFFSRMRWSWSHDLQDPSQHHCQCLLFWGGFREYTIQMTPLPEFLSLKFPRIDPVPAQIMCAIPLRVLAFIKRNRIFCHYPVQFMFDFRWPTGVDLPLSRPARNVSQIRVLDVATLAYS